jgi:hypothetical protein
MTARTPLSELDAAKLVLEMAPKALPGLGREGARLILGHTWGLELGRGRGARGHNIGNISAAGFNAQTKKEYFLKANRYWDGKSVWRPPWYSDPTDPAHMKMMKGEAPSAFRAYPSYREGLGDYLSLISRTDVGKGALAGDPWKFAKGVWDSRYCRDKGCAPQPLSRSLERFQKEFAAKGYFNSLPSTRRAKGSSLLLWGALGGGAWWMLKKQQKDAK